jgi:uncharacterized protein
MRRPVGRGLETRAKPIENMKLPSLIIQVNEIPEAGKNIEAELPVAWVSDTLLPPYEVLEPVLLSIEVRRVEDNVWVEGKVDMHLGFECSRTLARGEMTLRVRISELFQPSSRHHVNLGDGLDCDDLDTDEPYVFDEGRLDLEPLIREQLVLAQPPYPIVEPAPEGQSDVLAWSSKEQDIDPRWEQLKKLTIN